MYSWIVVHIVSFDNFVNFVNYLLLKTVLKMKDVGGLISGRLHMQPASPCVLGRLPIFGNRMRVAAQDARAGATSNSY